MGRIVCGVDGSDGAARALRWALDEGAARGWEVEVVHAWQPSFFVGSPLVVEPELDMLEEAGRNLLDQAVAAAGDGHEGREVHRTLVRGGPAEGVLAAAVDADLVVVGTRGRGGVARMLLGSVSHQVLQHARGSVAVVPSPADGLPAPEAGSIVVGVDGSAHSKAALAWAIDRAAATGGDVRAVMAWSYLDQRGTTFDPGLDVEDVRAALDVVLGEVPNPSGATVTGEVVNALPLDAVLDASKTAELVVVGARGTGGFKGLLVGSVSNKVVHHVHRPVVVVRNAAIPV